MAKIKDGDHYVGISEIVHYVDSDPYTMKESTYTLPIESDYNDSFFDVSNIDKHIGSQNRKFLLKNGKSKKGLSRCRDVAKPVASYCSFTTLLILV